MFSYKFDVNKLWREIYHYTKYKAMDDSMKITVDSIFEKICNNLERDSIGIESKPSMVLSFHDFSTTDLDNNHGNWLIDNNLKLLFSYCYGSHHILRGLLLDLYVVKEFGLNSDSLIELHENIDHIQYCDIYTAMHFGIYCSGANESKDLVHGKGYPFIMNRQQELSRWKNKKIPFYNKTDALSDLLKLIKATND